MEPKIYKSDSYAVKLVRDKTIDSIKKHKIYDSRSAYDVVKQFWSENMDIYESFYVVALNNANNTLSFMKVSTGGITGTVVDVRLVASFLLQSLAVGCILAHNHPSGTLKPSTGDLDITDKLVKGLKLLDIKVIDHLIITENEFYSFADNNKI